LTGAEDGACLPIAADHDPEDECSEGANFPSSCLADGACDGKRACRAFAKDGTSCGDTTCKDGGVTASVCDGSGTCQRESVLCAPYVCSLVSCTTSCKTDVDCEPATSYCVDGKCTAKKPIEQSGSAGSGDGSEAGSGGESGSSVGSAGEGTMNGGVGGHAGQVNADTGVGGHADPHDVSSKACSCRLAGKSAFAGDVLLPLLGLLLFARRARERRIYTEIAREE